MQRWFKAHRSLTVAVSYNIHTAPRGAVWIEAVFMREAPGPYTENLP